MTSIQSRLPLVKIDPKNEQRIRELGGQPIHLYQTLAHNPVLLSAWVEFAYSLRKNCSTSRQIRELLILRGAQISKSEYEWVHHSRMAREVGLSPDKIACLEDWQSSDLFTAPERSVLKLIEALVDGKVSDETYQEVQAHFSPSELIELILTGSFYCMVPRVLDALRVPVENDASF